MLSSKLSLPNVENALPGRSKVMMVENKHFVHGRPIQGPFDENLESVYLGLGCFWGAERKFWTMPGVYTTAVGYGAGLTPNPSYEEVCSGLTGHNEIVLVVFDPSKIQFSTLLSTFFEAHNPTQGMRQGNDQGTQYRSGIYCTTLEQENYAQHALQQYQIALDNAQLNAQITTEILPAPTFYYAEQYHQQYLAKNPNGYCGIGGVGVNCVL